MKKLLVMVFILGIFFSKISYTIYSYYWWKEESSIECQSIKINENYKFKDIHECVKKRIGIVHYLKYININLRYAWKKWEWIN